MSLRFERLELTAFGPFTDTTLELAPDPGSLHLVCGPNEAGKSSAQRAIGDFLFGIPPRSRDNHLHPYADMRLGAVLVSADGERVALTRRKGNRSTLLGHDGQPVEETVLESLLAGMSRQAFGSMFSITHDSLISGGEALLAVGGELGESLFSASLGAAALHQLRERLSETADGLFRPRASSSLIMQARAGLEQAVAAQREQTLRVSTFEAAEDAHRAVAAKRMSVAERLRAEQVAQGTRRRLRAVLPLVAEHERIQDAIAALAHVPSLPADSTERRVRAQAQLASAQASVRATEQRIAELRQRLAELEVPSGLLARRVTITALNDRLAVVRERAVERAALVGELTLATALAQETLAEVRPDLEAAERASLPSLVPGLRQRVDELLEQHTRLQTELAGAERGAEEARAQISRAEAALAQLPAPVDIIGLRATLAEAVGQGQLQERLSEAHHELSAATAALGAAVGDLEPGVSLDVLNQGPYPNAARLEHFAVRHADLTQREGQLAGEREQLAAARRELDEDDARLRLEGAIPSAGDLRRARSERDSRWSVLRRSLTGDHSAAAEPELFEQSVAQADRVADRLAEHADRAARAAQLAVRRDRLSADAAGLEARGAQLTDDRTAYAEDWTALWERFGITPDPPRVMAEWLRQRQLVLDRAVAVSRRRQACADLESLAEVHRAALAAALSGAGRPPAEAATLAHLVSLAQGLITAAEAGASRALELQSDLRHARNLLAEETERVHSAHAAVARWASEWAAFSSSHGWLPGISPERARDLVGGLELLAARLKTEDHLTTRRSVIDQTLQAFEADAQECIAEVAPELGALPALDAVSEVFSRLEAALQAQSEAAGAQRDLEIALRQSREAAVDVQRAEGDLAGLMAAAGVGDAEELPAMEERAAVLVELTRRRPELERQIVESGEAPLAEILARASGIQSEELDADLTAADHELAGLQDLLTGHDVRLGELRAERQQMEARGGSADASQQVEQARAQLRDLVERYLRVQVAAWALSEAIDAYRREHKDPLLRRAAELFPQLTCGSFAGLEVGFGNGDDPVLIGVRPNRDQVEVEGMSTGTREQLYLALRLASLERHVALQGPLPVVFDDVVLHSDPRRRRAILQAIGELSRQTQVIVFTHDPSLIALAEESLEAGLLTVHEIGDHGVVHRRAPTRQKAEVRPIRRTRRREPAGLLGDAEHRGGGTQEPLWQVAER